MLRSSSFLLTILKKQKNKMAPNANGRNSPNSVIDLTPILTIGVRDYDINVTISMFEHHLEDIIDFGDEPAEFLRVTQARLHLLKAGHADWRTMMIPDVNSGHYLDAEEWFTRYGFAPDMILGTRTQEEVDDEILDAADRRTLEWLNETDLVRYHWEDDDGTETTASVTLGSKDTEVSELSADDKWEDIKKNGFKTEHAYPLPDEEFELDLESIDSWELNMQTSNNNRG